MAFFENDYMTGPPDYRAMRQLTGTQDPQAQQQNPLEAFLRMFEMVMQGNAAQTEAALKPRGKISTDEKNTFGRVGRQPGKSGLETWAAMNPNAPRGQEAIDASRGQDYQTFRHRQTAMRNFLARGGDPQANDPERLYRPDPFTALEIDYHNMMNGDRIGPAASAATQAILDRMRQLDPTRAAEFVGKGYTSGPSQGQWVNDPLGRRPPKATPVERYPNPSTGKGPIYDGEVPPKAIPVAGAPVDPPIGRAVPVKKPAKMDPSVTVRDFVGSGQSFIQNPTLKNIAGSGQSVAKTKQPAAKVNANPAKDNFASVKWPDGWQMPGQKVVEKTPREKTPLKAQFATQPQVNMQDGLLGLFNALFGSTPSNNLPQQSQLEKQYAWQQQFPQQGSLLDVFNNKISPVPMVTPLERQFNQQPQGNPVDYLQDVLFNITKQPMNPLHAAQRLHMAGIIPEGRPTANPLHAAQILHMSGIR